MRVLVFGDSITQGFWAIEGGWVERLRKYYDSRQVSDLEGQDEPTIFNLGISADNSSNILKRVGAETVARTRHGQLPVVIVQIGVNDSLRDSLPLDQYRNNLVAIIEKLKPISSKIIFVGSTSCNEAKTTPVFWGDFYYTNKAIKAYELQMKEVALEQGLTFIPVFDKFFAAVEQGADLLPDGLHPNDEGHKLVYEIVLVELAPLLKS